MDTMMTSRIRGSEVGTEGRIILGIDPGSLVAGFGVLQLINDEIRHISNGVIMLDKTKPFAQRLADLQEDTHQLCQQFKPNCVAIEKIFLGKNADSAFKLGHARGVMLASVCRAGAEVSEYSTREVKKGVTSKGSADKTEVAFVLQNLLSLKMFVKADATDALAMAYFHCLKLKERQLIASAYQV
jgi:crossover junction endodeoxyribonuclease RuvC